MLRPVLNDDIFAFPPNRDTLGGTAYLVKISQGSAAPAYGLIDAPPWGPETRQAIADYPIRWLVLTHRGSLGQTARIQQHLGCEVIIQEQEAYLLPETACTTFTDGYEVSPEVRLLWTPGHSPGSTCVYYSAHGGVLFTGRHLLPDQSGRPRPMRFSKTFHWPRQLRQVERLQAEFTATTLAYLCPGASLGLLRGQRSIGDAYGKLQAIDIEACRQARALL